MDYSKIFLIIIPQLKFLMHDSGLTQYYGEQIKTMPKTRAIVKVARKLLNRIRTVWQDKINYAEGVVK